MFLRIESCMNELAQSTHTWFDCNETISDISEPLKENHSFQNQVFKDGFSKTADGNDMDYSSLYHGQAGPARGSHILSHHSVYQRCGGGIHFLQNISTSTTRYVIYNGKGMMMQFYFFDFNHILIRILIWLKDGHQIYSIKHCMFFV